MPLKELIPLPLLLPTPQMANFGSGILQGGSYSLSFVPNDTIHKDAQRNVSVTAGQTAIVDTVRLEKK